ncbi:MAG: hypothetical protein WCL50_02890 [Spirochaetota bacterium]
MSRPFVTRFLLAFYLGLAAYGSLSIIAGPGGVIASARLAKHTREMGANLVSLKILNQTLNSELGSLSGDPDRARREARSLGFLAPGEFEVVIMGQADSRSEKQAAGIIIPYEIPLSLADGQVKIFAFVVALFSLAFLRIPSERHSIESRRPAVPRRRKARGMSAPASSS